MKNLLKNLTSRPFIVLIVAVVAFFTTDKFTESGLITTFLIYCGYNVANKFVKGKPASEMPPVKEIARAILNSKMRPGKQERAEDWPKPVGDEKPPPRKP